ASAPARECSATARECSAARRIASACWTSSSRVFGLGFEGDNSLRFILASTFTILAKAVPVLNPSIGAESESLQVATKPVRGFGPPLPQRSWGVSGHCRRPNLLNALRSTPSFRRGNCTSMLQLCRRTAKASGMQRWDNSQTTRLAPQSTYNAPQTLGEYPSLP